MKHNPFFLALVALLSILIGADPALAVPTVSNSPASATRPGYVTTGAQTFAGAKTFTGATVLGTTSITALVLSSTLTASGTATFNKTAETSVGEAIANFGVSDASTDGLFVENGTTTASRMWATIRGVHATGTTLGGLQLIAQVGADTGSAAAGTFRTRVGSGSSAVGTRTLWDWLNGNATVLSFLPLNSGANLALSWGTQSGAAPAFTTRSNGVRLLLHSDITGALTDHAIGYSAGANWYGVPAANISYVHRFYAGTSIVMDLRGDGLLTNTGGHIEKVRVATATPVTVAVTDFYVITKLAAPGAVAVNLPASPTTGTVFKIKDGTGDAGANNITITPAAGTIDGAATKVIATNYGSVTLVYSGTEWLSD